MSGFDAIVVGAGHNGLVAAATLAKAGRKVLVLEQADAVGGAARTVHLAPGLRAPQLAHLLHNLSPTVVQELNLAAHGLEFAATDLPTVSLSPDGRHVGDAGGRAPLGRRPPPPRRRRLRRVARPPRPLRRRAGTHAARTRRRAWPKAAGARHRPWAASPCGCA